ncbi:MAG: hypothetical protein BWY72_02238 [Bacteroidetes bacterium ADurb.Bin416]|nr:MAG: hypothetical protein BWY72_02238 [Bacteroidetes bacterium ADurb.Bin416]
MMFTLGDNKKIETHSQGQLCEKQDNHSRWGFYTCFFACLIKRR